MIRLVLATFLLTAAAQPCRAEVTFDWAHVGNSGNAADPETGFGAVSYNYAISKTEVTNAQYTAFLNAVDPTGANASLGGGEGLLYDSSMGGNLGGIENTGAIDGTRYVVRAGFEQKAVTHISFSDAMRFVNWLHNGQGSGGTEAGVYEISNGIDEVRSVAAKYWIPSEDEWYKAAYHDASAGAAGVYFDYAISSDSLPVSDQPGDDSAAANYRNDDGITNGYNDGYAVSGSNSFGLNPFTDVGSYTTALSPYGTFDQNGSASEWNEAVTRDSKGADRGLRGGAWNGSSSSLSATRRGNGSNLFVTAGTGFRIATIPEPTTATLLIFAAIGARERRRS